MVFLQVHLSAMAKYAIQVIFKMIMEFIRNIEQLTELSNNTYTGYYWLSDQETPVKILNQKVAFETYNLIPFIIEALLIDEVNNKSIHITHDGNYRIYEYDLSLISNFETTSYEVIPFRLNGVERLKFLKVWAPERDENCENFETLKLKAIVFNGFKN